ncbi:hypothetical protein BASA81_010156 [Batrachochytrium salamandrivorans]|nr:hypothetical protein BASA81_010156 [Batrachochytrium salamandrivorans]
MNRSARAVLMWMGIYQNHRNALGIRTNTLLLTLHWLKTGSGALDLVEKPGGVLICFNTRCDSLKPGEDSSVLVLMRILSRELDLIQTTCPICFAFGSKMLRA